MFCYTDSSTYLPSSSTPIAGLSFLDLLAQLQQAYQLFEERQFAKAALLFVQLTDWAIAADLLERAASLSLTAARAYFNSDQSQPALRCLRQGLRLLEQTNRSWRAGQILLTMISILNDRCQHGEAIALQNEFAHLLP